MIKDYTNQMRKIELRTKEAEKRASEAMTQVLLYIAYYVIPYWLCNVFVVTYIT